ncbi:hypothetical protein [Kribbia dieselivorans]|uniref:hypothetical protein n=1 Tax=Kribbia dieselivorans TaxID=331526 RepID=UPI001470641F|nr:hypothetical protein [Kribbia dieselivorans]
MKLTMMAWTAIAALSVSLVSTSAVAGNSLCTRSATNGYRACVYVDANWVGMFKYKWEGSGLTNVSNGDNDVMTSWENPSRTRNGAWYEDASGGGACHNMLAQRESSYVGWLSNDTMSSWRMNDAC